MSETPGSFITTGTTTAHDMDDIEWIRVSRLARVRLEIRASAMRCILAIVDVGTFEIGDEMRAIGQWLIAHALPVAGNDTAAADLAIERRAADIFAAVVHFKPLHMIMSESELMGWDMHVCVSRAINPVDHTPTCDAEWAGWLAREIHYTNARAE